MIIDLNVIADEKQKQDKIGEVIFKMNELGMIDSLDFAGLINMVNGNLINAKEQELDSLRKENQQLKESATNNSNELKQAEKDMKEVNQKSKDVLNNLK